MVACVSVTVLYLCLKAAAAHVAQDVDGIASMRMPTTLRELQSARHVLHAAVQAHLPVSLAAFSLTYLFKQAFSIPGSSVLNLAAGALFGSAVGIPLVCALTTAGASCSYLMSASYGGAVVRRLEARVAPVRDHVRQAERNGTLWWYLLFARVLPFSPNWLLNLCAPWVGVPLRAFAPSVLLGLCPYNFVTVRSGALLEQLTSANSAMDAVTVAQMVVLAAVMLLPVVLRKQARRLSEAHVRDPDSDAFEADDASSASDGG